MKNVKQCHKVNFAERKTHFCSSQDNEIHGANPKVQVHLMPIK